MTSRKEQLHLFTCKQIFQISPLPLPLLQLKQGICKSRTPESRAPIYPAQKCNHNCCILYFSFFSFIKSPLFLLISMEKDGVPWPVDIWRCWREDMYPLLQFSYSLSFSGGGGCSEDIRKQKVELCVLPELPLLLPHAARQRKRKAGHKAHTSLAGETWAST